MTIAWTWAAAAAIGTSHMQSGTLCQDAFACRVWRSPSGSEVLLAALADGAGSAERADGGAKLASALSIEVAGELLADGADYLRGAGELIRHAATAAREALEARAAHEGRDIDDFACTLLMALLHGSGGAVGQIGDGAIVAAGGNEAGWRVLMWPEHGEYLNTTRFLTETDALQHLRVEELSEPVDSVCLFSDGLERLVLDFGTRTAHGPFFEAVCNRFEAASSAGYNKGVSSALAELLSSEAVNRRTDDDKSIVCVRARIPIYGTPCAAQG
jgi:hypothetical protein